MVYRAQSPVRHHHYDAVIAGARCAGASTAMLLARRGLRVLVVDPARRGSDTLSTHALMRGGVLQLHRWGVLDAIRDAETPPIRKTTFHYGDEHIEVSIKPRDGMDALYAPRRTVLDSVLADAAEAAGAELVFGCSVVDLLRDRHGRVRGVTIAGADRREFDVAACIVIGADGLRSRVARIVGAEREHAARHASASIYRYYRGLDLEGFHWFYKMGASVGSIPTNDGDTCVFASVAPARFEASRKNGLEPLYREILNEVSPMLADLVAGLEISGKLRAFPGTPGFLRRAAGPGWALVGDAAYFKDPITAHGITDALRDAELLARAVVTGGDEALARYQSTRDTLVKGLFQITDRLASFEWDLDEAKADHLALSREMNAEVDVLRELDGDFVAAPVVSAVAS
jgi:2-polyprenyl-6-methoxyphenol hydroxylase-like FAD-dependent oxidoreductase